MTVVALHHGKTAYRFHHAAAGGIIWGAHNAGRLYEQDLLEAIAARRLAGVYVDVGAGIGNHTRFFAEECRSSLVIAIEPAPIAQALLHRNAEGSRTPIRIIEGFATDQPELAWVLRKGVLHTAQPDDAGAVHGVKLDAILRALDDGLGPVACIKIDVENHEPMVLRGAAETLLHHSPLLAMEAWNEGALAEQVAVLAPLGYMRHPKRYCSTPTYLWTRKAS
jgi:FkbM family methyltransferase